MFSISFQFKLDVSSSHKEDIFIKLEAIPGVEWVDQNVVCVEEESLNKVKQFLSLMPVGNVVVESLDKDFPVSSSVAKIRKARKMWEDMSRADKIDLMVKSGGMTQLQGEKAKENDRRRQTNG